MGLPRILPALALPFAVLAAAAPARAAEEPAPRAAAPEGPQVIRVGVYLMNVGRFDLATGSYTMDFYLTLRSDRPIPDQSFEFMNGRASSFERIREVEDPGKGEFRREIRIQASLYRNVSLKDYPFDRHFLPIQIEDKRRGAAELAYEVDAENCGLDPEVTVVGWDLLREGTGARVSLHDYGDEVFSRFEYGVELRRIVLTSILKAFLPAFFIVVVGVLGLLLLPDKVVPRLTMTTSALLGTVMFHLTVTSQIPPVGYLTFADRFMIVSYVVLLACLAATILLMRHTDQKDEARARAFYAAALRWIPPGGALLYLLAFLTR